MGEIHVLERPIAAPFEDVASPEMLPLEERPLIVVDYLLRRRLPDGTYLDSTLERVHTDLCTATKEMAIPHAISNIEMDRVTDGVYITDDQTSIEVAESGLKYHHDPAARERAFVEIEEAKYNAATLRPGIRRAFLSPRMTETDAPKEVATREHLGSDDALRITELCTDENGDVTHMRMQAILVRDVPLEAWVALLRDPNNIFGRAITIENEQSALSVMKVFDQLELSVSALQGGVKDLVGAVIPYIKDKEAQQSVETQYEMLHSDQHEIHDKASNIADRWLAFEVELAESIHQERATSYIQDFIAEFDGIWGEATEQLLARQRLHDGSIYMTRELAVKIEQVRAKTLWVKASVANNNRAVIEQLDTGLVEQIAAEEAYMQAMHHQGYTMHQILVADSTNNRIVAQQQVKGDAGCPGEVTADIKTAGKEEGAEGNAADRGNIGAQEVGAESGKECTYKFSGCYCCPYDEYGKPLSRRVEVTVRRYGNGVARCLRGGCGAALDAKGNVMSRGGIYEKAMQYLRKEGEVGSLAVAGAKASD